VTKHREEKVPNRNMSKPILNRNNKCLIRTFAKHDGALKIEADRMKPMIKGLFEISN